MGHLECIDWLNGPAPKGFMLADMQRARYYFKKQNNEYVSEVWLAIVNSLSNWIKEQSGSFVFEYGLADVSKCTVFKIPKNKSGQYMLCSDLIFTLATVGKYQPIIDVVNTYSFEHVMASVSLYYAISGKKKEANRSMYWLDRKRISKYTKEKQVAGEESHATDKDAEKFARKMASCTWGEQIEDGDPVMNKTDMLTFLSDMLKQDGFKGRSTKGGGYTDKTIWKWVKDLAPSEVTKPGRRAHKKSL